MTSAFARMLCVTARSRLSAWWCHHVILSVRMMTSSRHHICLVFDIIASRSIRTTVDWHIARVSRLAYCKARWSIQCQARTTYNLNVINKTAKNDKTLCDMIIALPSKTGNTTTPLFMSIDLPWKGSGYTIQFHPDKAMEASMVIKGLYTAYSRIWRRYKRILLTRSHYRRTRHTMGPGNSKYNLFQWYRGW